MPRFGNSPNMRDSSGEQRVRRWVHSPLTFEHYDVKAQIKENGKVILSQGKKTNDGKDVEIQEIEFSASLVFKLADALNLTRRSEWVSVDNLAKEAEKA